MPTPNAPRIPHPTLEKGIPQYPTPYVPDFYTRMGHIILVDKISSDKGSYNPQPLDGTVIYTGQDANKFPDTLYLVAERPTEDGLFVVRFWANDRTLESQDPWNYGLAYSLNHPSFKIVTRTYITPREDYTPVALGSVDPVFGGTAIISKQEMAELPDDNPLRSRYVQVQRVYETIPSSIITGQRLTERGDIETLDTQIVVAGTNPDADGLLVTQTAVEAVDAVKSKRTKGSVASYSILTTKVKKAGLLGEASVTDNIVSPTTNPDALSTTVLDSTVEAISATKSRKRTTTSSGPTSLTSPSKKAGLLGEVSVVESIVAAGSSADNLSTTIISSEITAIDSAKSKKTTTTASGPTSLTAKKISERGDTQTITKSIVAASEGVTADSLTLVSSQVDEIDSAKSQKTDVTVASYSALATKVKKSGLLGEVTISDDIVAPATNPDGLVYNGLGTSIVDSTVEAISATKSRKRTTYTTGPYSLTGYQYDDFFETQLTITESIVPYGSAAPTLGHGILSYKDDAIDLTKSKRIVVSTPSLPPTRTEYKTGSYTSPLLVFNIVSDSANLACAPFIADIKIKLTPITRASQTGPTTYKTVTSYSYGAPVASDDDIFLPVLKEVAFTGYVINFNLNAALCDTLAATIRVVNCSLGTGVDESWNIAASSPYSATDYLGKVGSYQKVSWESRYWKAGIWESKTIYVKLI